MHCSCCVHPSGDHSLQGRDVCDRQENASAESTQCCRVLAWPVCLDKHIMVLMVVAVVITILVVSSGGGGHY